MVLATARGHRSSSSIPGKFGGHLEAKLRLCLWEKALWQYRVIHDLENSVIIQNPNCEINAALNCAFEIWCGVNIESSMTWKFGGRLEAEVRKCIILISTNNLEGGSIGTDVSISWGLEIENPVSKDDAT